MQPLKFAIGTSNDRIAAWQRACVSKLCPKGLGDLRYVIRSKAPKDASTQKSQPFYDYLKRLDIPSQRVVNDWDFDQASPREGVTYSEMRATQPPSPNPLQGADLDFILVFGPKQAGLPFVNIAKFGVWYFVHGDIAHFESEAPGFWEIYHDLDVTAAFLLRLHDEASAGFVLRAAYLPTDHSSFEMNVENVFSCLSEWPAQICDQMQRGVTWPSSMLTPAPPYRYGTPSRNHIASMEALLAKNRKAIYVQNTLHAIEWNIAALKSELTNPPTQTVEATVDVLCPHMKGQYLADPCLFAHESKMFVFCEHHSRATNKGIISVFEVIDGVASRLQPVIEEPFHLSYPQVFEHRGQIYCMPESGEARCVSLYRAVDFPNRWERAHTIIKDFGAIDSTIVQIDEKWWLFCTDRDVTNRRAHNSHLYLWYARDLLGPWTPHPKNPIKIDVRSSRPAGKLFRERGTWYRPAQDCSRTYGGQLCINEILRLSETDFEERIVATIRPPRFGYNKGLHTISRADSLTVVDVKRHVFKPSGLVDLVRNSMKRLAIRLGVSEETIRALKQKLRR